MASLTTLLDENKDVKNCSACKGKACTKSTTNRLFCAYFNCLNNYQPTEDKKWKAYNCDITPTTLDGWEKEWKTIKGNENKNFWTQQGFASDRNTNAYVSFETLARWKYAKFPKIKNVKQCLDHIVDKIYGDMKNQNGIQKYIDWSKGPDPITKKNNYMNYVNHLILQLKDQGENRDTMLTKIQSYMTNKEFITRAIGADAFSTEKEEVFMTWLTKDFYFSKDEKQTIIGSDLESRQPTNILCFMMMHTFDDPKQKEKQIRHIFWDKLKDENGKYNPDYNFKYNPYRQNAIQVLCNHFWSRKNEEKTMLEEWISQKHIRTVNGKQELIPIHVDSLDYLIYSNTLGEDEQPQALWMISEFWDRQEKLNPNLKRIQMSDSLYNALKTWVEGDLYNMKKAARKKYLEDGGGTFFGQEKENRKDMLSTFFTRLEKRLSNEKLKVLENKIPYSLSSLSEVLKKAMTISWRPFLQLKF